VERYATPSLGALVVLAAYGLARVRSRAALAVVLVATVLAAGYGVVRWYDNPGLAAFDDVAESIDARLQPGDALALATDRSRTAVEFELRDRGALRERLAPGFPADPWGTFATGEQTGEPITTDAVESLAATHPRLWVISGFYDRADEVQQAVDRLEREYTLASRREFGGQITLYLFERVDR
jgi:hypothetical protein